MFTIRLLGYDVSSSFRLERILLKIEAKMKEKFLYSHLFKTSMKRLVVLLLLILTLGCISQEKGNTEENLGEETNTGNQEESPSKGTYTEEESLNIAREFVVNSSTYKFDGEELRHVETIPGECSTCWVFVFEFTSRHAGYGDRSKQMLIQVMTKHTAKVTVENGKVMSAVLDDVWDMINEEMIK